MDLRIFSTTRTRLLPEPQDTYLYPGRPSYDKRRRTKKMAKERTNEERGVDNFFYIFPVTYSKISEKSKPFQKKHKNPSYILIIYKYYILEEQ